MPKEKVLLRLLFSLLRLPSELLHFVPCAARPCRFPCSLRCRRLPPTTISSSSFMCLMDARMHTSPKSSFAPSSNDSAKKKRVHRAAKLKQCKLDARREQWLSQVSSRASKHVSGSCQDSENGAPLSHPSRDTLEIPLDDCGSRHEVVTVREEQLHVLHEPNASDASENHHAGSHEKEANCNGSAPHKKINACSNGCITESGACITDQKAQVGDAGQNGNALVHSWSSSEVSSSGSNSGHESSSSGSDDDDNEVEDWETVADALHTQTSLEEKKVDVDPIENRQREFRNNGLWNSHAENCVLKPQSKFRPENPSVLRMRADACRAWRPDDALRPVTLPCLKKQNSFPIQSGVPVWGTSRSNVWSLPPAPSHCPICTEELDITDSSFLPCPCGFRLCLFCHHRIVINDGRCPGCRKSYNLEATLKLSRSSTMRPKLSN